MRCLLFWVGLAMAASLASHAQAGEWGWPRPGPNAPPPDRGQAAGKDPMGEAGLPATESVSVSGEASPPAQNSPPKASRGGMPASPRPVIEAQPDGTKIALRVRGDERFNWQEDINGYPVVRSPDGGYVYAIVGPQGRLRPTGLIVGKADPARAGVRKARPAAPKLVEGATATDSMDEPRPRPPVDPMGNAPPPSSARPKTAPGASRPAGGKDPMETGQG